MTPMTAAPSPGQPWRSKRDVAAYYGVSTRTVERWVRAGLNARRVGGVLRFRFDDVERFIDEDLNEEN